MKRNLESNQNDGSDKNETGSEAKKLCSEESMFRKAMSLDLPSVSFLRNRPTKSVVKPTELRKENYKNSQQIIYNLFMRKLGTPPTDEDVQQIKTTSFLHVEGATIMYLKTSKIKKECDRIFQQYLGRDIDKETLSNFTNGLLSEKVKLIDIENLTRNSEECKRSLSEKSFQHKLLNIHYTYDDVKHLIVSDKLKNLRIKYMGPVGRTGYAAAVKAYVYSLFIHGAQVTFQMIQKHYSIGDNHSDKDKVLYACMNSMQEYDVVVVHSIPDVWKHFVEQEKARNPKIITIGLTVWEANKIHPAWRVPMNGVDLIMTPCEWNKSVFSKDVGIPVYTIHTPVDNLATPDEEYQLDGVEKNDFVFYSINEWNNRKGIEDTIDVFLKNFTARENVVLYLKCATFREELAQNFINQERARYNNPPKIILNTKDISDNQISQIHKRGNVYVSLTRSEGTGLGAVEACLYDNPVIMSSYGGQQDFLKGVYFVTCTEETPNMCSKIQEGHGTCKQGVICHKYPWYTQESKWGMPSKIDAGKLFRFVFENYNDCKLSASVPKKFVQKNMNSEVIGLEMGNIILDHM
jgi:glycosyltransferase involved in cell wall biosynthesis